MNNHTPKKKCSKCGQEKSADTEHFSRKSDRPDGLYSLCKECKSASDRLYRQTSKTYKDSHRVRSAQYRIDNPQRRREIKARSYQNNKVHALQYERTYRKAHPEKSRFRVKAYGSRRRGAAGRYAPSDIVKLYELQNGRCIYCGIRLFMEIAKDIHVDHMLPLKRGGNNRFDNLCLACWPCNAAKRDKTPEEWSQVRGW